VSELTVRTVFDHKGMASISVDGQHLSRITSEEVREIVLQCIVFGGKNLREDVRKWLSDAEFESMALIVAKGSSEVPA
jgi:hypothetical protein